MPDRDKILSTRDHQVRFINGTNGEVLRSLPISTGKGVVALDAVNKAEDTIRNVTPENSLSAYDWSHTIIEVKNVGRLPFFKKRQIIDVTLG